MEKSPLLASSDGSQEGGVRLFMSPPGAGGVLLYVHSPVPSTAKKSEKAGGPLAREAAKPAKSEVRDVPVADPFVDPKTPEGLGQHHRRSARPSTSSDLLPPNSKLRGPRGQPPAPLPPFSLTAADTASAKQSLAEQVRRFAERIDIIGADVSFYSVPAIRILIKYQTLSMDVVKKVVKELHQEREEKENEQMEQGLLEPADARKLTADLKARTLRVHNVVAAQQWPAELKDLLQQDLYRIINLVGALDEDANRRGNVVDRTMITIANMVMRDEKMRAEHGSAIHELQAQLQNDKERLENLDAILESMRTLRLKDEKTIQHLREQLAGKRNLWLEHYADPAEKSHALGAIKRSSPPPAKPTLNLTYGPAMGAPEVPRYLQESWRKPSRVTSQAVPASVYQAAPASIYNPATRIVYQQIPNSILQGYESRVPPSIAAAETQDSGQRASKASLHRAVSAMHIRRQPSLARFDNTRTSADRRSGHSGADELGSPVPRMKQPALTTIPDDPVSEAPDAEAVQWAKEFSRMFNLVLGFCNSYMQTPAARDIVQHIKTSSPPLWKYMCRVISPADEAAGEAQATALLKDAKTRPHLVQRLIAQHMVLFMFSAEGWLEFDTEHDAVMKQLTSQLSSKAVIKPHERQAIVDRQAELVQSMTVHDKWASFRQYKVNDHFQKLKKMMGPLVCARPSHNMHQEAFYDLHNVTTSAWDLSAKLVLSRLTFSYMWNDTGAKYSNESHVAIENREDPVILQIKQARIKLAVTPIITMRDDRGLAVMPKCLSKSKVLIIS
ncbi:hypothetical protein B0T26DRAFT_876318 [Lasiosphaeria miniovina]|uniref:Uncharacterized protein n=1 Tax=Lasiosphaeria miniovina TaxID=1954250 RepID=A0AA39ZTD0_9PEZI|nr:uncharacterized protein B0T26DRAFT_876318 [Lasiosphaeria miniovina]KAK0703258.1 hypothetical protein B0T26DRAFT_876318 [Lasiosphaeria miniovina]